jgi:hypothetical protein
MALVAMLRLQASGDQPLQRYVNTIRLVGISELQKVRKMEYSDVCNIVSRNEMGT